MKKLIPFFIFILFAALSSCTKKGDDTIVLPDKIEEVKEVAVSRPNDGQPFSPSNADMLSQGVSPVNASGSSVRSGTIPSSNSNQSSLQLTETVSEQIASNGSTLQLPVSTAGGQPSGYYVQIVGSDTYYQIPASSDNSSTIALSLPSNVTAGTFNVTYAAYDANGSVGVPSTTKVTVLKLGTGVMQFTLTWNKEVDIDLYVKDPNGDYIYFANKEVSSGGQLDRDDLDGYGPENIFWEKTAPDGDYIVAVDFYSGTGNIGYVVNLNTSNYSKTYNGTLTYMGQTHYLVKVTKKGNEYTFSKTTETEFLN
jgi:hypothetical protein